MLTIVQPPIMSPFTNATGVADVHITSQQSVFSGFNIQKQVECGNIKFNGLESCDYIATFGSADVPPGKLFTSRYSRLKWNRIPCTINDRS